MPFRLCYTKTGMSYLSLWVSEYFSKPDAQKSKRDRGKWWRLLRKRNTWTLRISGLEPILGHKFCPTCLKLILCKREENCQKQWKSQNFEKKNQIHVPKLFQVLKPFLKCKFPTIWPTIILPESFLKKKHGFFRNFHDFDHFSLIYTGTQKKTHLLTILQKLVEKNFCRPIIFSKRSQTSKFFFERLLHPLDFFRIKYLHRHTRCRCSRWTRPKKTEKKHIC